MAHQYRDAVVLIQKSRDGTLTRVNAIVLASTVQPANVNRHHALKSSGAVLPAGEYLDLAYPRDLAGHQLKSSDMDAVFQKAYHVPRWSEGSWIGWEPVGLPSPSDLDAIAAEEKSAEETSGA